MKILFSIALAIGLFLASCSSALSDDRDGTSDPDTAQTGGSPAANFDITLYTGAELVGQQETSFSALLSLGRPVVLNMWAGICTPCRLEMPDFQEVNDAYGDDILVFGLDVGPFANLGSNKDGQELVKELGITYPNGSTGDKTVVQDYNLLGIPTTYFITPDGEILRRWTGPLTADRLGKLVDELLQVSGS